MSSTWVLSRTSEYVRLHLEELGKTVEYDYIWETIYLDKFWQVQRRHNLSALNSTSTAMGYNSTFEEDHYELFGNETGCTCRCSDCVFCCELPYRILATCGEFDIVVAIADSSHSIMKQHLQYLTQNVSPLLELLYQEHERQTSSSTFDDDELDYSMIQFVVLKVRALIRREPKDKFKETQAFVGSPEYFYHHFDEDELGELQYCSSCALWSNIYYGGGLYITREHLCFVSIDSSFRFIIPLSSIIEFETSYLQIFQQNCISFSTSKFEEYHIFEFQELNECLDILSKLWQRSMKEFLSYRVRRTSKIAKNVRHSSLADNLNQLQKVQRIIPFYTNPIRSVILSEHCTGSFISQAGKKSSFRKMEGILDISFHSLYFKSPNSFSIVIPFPEIKTISKSRQSKETVTIHLHGISHQVKFMFASKESMIILLQLYKLDSITSKSNIIPPRVCISTRKRKQNIGNPSMSNPISRRRFQLFHSEEDDLIEIWNDFFAKYGTSSCLLRTKLLTQMIHKGIPAPYRSFMWQFCCGSLYYQYQGEKTYEYYLLNSSVEPETDAQIERDLDRTMPHHPFFLPGEGSKIGQLRNVLRAYSCKNPKIGYCQGMNVICAFLLLYLNAEEAFHCLGAICEKIVPGYYETSLWGIQLDQLVLDALIKKYLPTISEHINFYLGGALLVCFEWFMCFLGRCLPFEIALRVFDWVLLDGAKALFVVSMSLLKYFESEILNYIHSTDLLDYLKYNMLTSVQSDNLFQLMLRFNSKITDEEIDSLRLSLAPDETPGG